MTGDHRRFNATFNSKNLSRTEGMFSCDAFAPNKSQGWFFTTMFSLQVRQTRVAALLGVFGGSAMLWVFWTSGCYAFVFQQPIGIGPEIRLARGPDFSSAWQKGPLGTRLNNTKHFLCPIRSRHPLEFLEIVRLESVPRGSFARTWKLSSRLFSRPDWLPLGLQGCSWHSPMA